MEQLVKQLEDMLQILLKKLTTIGVFQGKQAEDLVTFFESMVTLLLNKTISVEYGASKYLTSSVLTVADAIDVKKYLSLFLKSPFIRNVVDITNVTVLSIEDAYSDQITEITTFLSDLYDTHKDFFQPIFDGVSSRLLIITNALQALVSGQLTDCAGNTNPNFPTGSLKNQLDKWISDVKSIIYKIIGLSGTDESEGKPPM